MKGSRFLILVCLFTVLLIPACSEVKPPLVGELAPSFALRDASGKLHRLKEYRGKWVLLHFWADWCASCRAEFPKLQTAWERFRGSEVVIIAVNAGQTGEHVREFRDEFGTTFPMLIDEQAAVAEKYGVRGLPMNFLLGPEQKVRRVILGWIEENQLAQLLSEYR